VAGPHVGRALVGAVAGYAFATGSATSSQCYTNVAGSGQNDVPSPWAVDRCVGWLAGAGMLDYPLAKLVGASLCPGPSKSWTRYFGPALTTRSSTPVTIVVLLFFFTGGLMAWPSAGAAEPTNHVFGPGTTSLW